MICRQCGTAIADKALICYRCGTPTALPREKTAPPARSRSGAPIIAVAVVVVLVAAGVLLMPLVSAGAPRMLAYAGLVVIAFLMVRLVGKRSGRRS